MGNTGRDPRKKAGPLGVFAGLWFLCVAWALPQARAEDLQEVFRQAVATDPLLKKEKDLFEAKSAEISSARWALGPKLDLTAGAGIAILDATLGLPRVSTGTTTEFYTVLLTQPIVDGQRVASLKATKLQAQAQRAMVLYEEEDLILRVVQAYFNVLQSEANERVAQEELELLEKVWKQATTFLTVGRGDAVAVAQAKAGLDSARAARIAAANTTRLARKALERLTHRPVGRLADVAPVKPLGPDPKEAEPWVRTALDNQPVLQQARALLQSSLAQVEQSQRAQWPTLSLVGFSGALGINAVPVRIYPEGALLTVSLPLFDGQIQARVKEAKAQARASQEELKNVMDQVKLATEEAFLNLENSVAQLQSAETAVGSAKISLESTQKGYGLGTRSVLDVLTAVKDYAAARRDYFLALYRHLVARVQLKAAAGIVSPEDVRALNRLLRKE